MNRTGFTQKVNTEADAKALLEHIKAHIRSDDYVFINRGKNRSTILSLGITPAIVRYIIFDLEATDYCSGPEADKDFPADKQVAVFGYDFRGTELYIKFSFGTDGLPVVLLSFHEPEYLMKYPF